MTVMWLSLLQWKFLNMPSKMQKMHKICHSLLKDQALRRELCGLQWCVESDSWVLGWAGLHGRGLWVRGPLYCRRQIVPLGLFPQRFQTPEILSFSLPPDSTRFGLRFTYYICISIYYMFRCIYYEYICIYFMYICIFASLYHLLQVQQK